MLDLPAAYHVPMVGTEIATSPEPPKPRFRGRSHEWAFFASLGLAPALILAADGTKATVAFAIYAAAVCGLFGASALYHRVTWSPGARRWMRRLDHSMIFVMIAGTYTPFALLVLSGTLATVVLWVVWGGAIGGVVFKLVWIDAPKLFIAAVYVALGSVGVVVIPQLLSKAGVAATTLIVVGGLLYIAGAVIYALRRPDPSPAVFGYHEVFHTLVIAAAAAHYVAVGAFVAPSV